jgi:hypothetical protein
LEKTDYQLMALGLSKDQISKQSLKELTNSLSRIDGYIDCPNSFFKAVGKGNASSEKEFRHNVLPILLEHRLLVLDSMNDLVSSCKLMNLKRLTKRISDQNIKFSIEKVLNDLQKKDSIFRKEHRKLVKLRLDLYSELQRFPLLLQELTSSRKQPSHKIDNQESITILVAGIMLILMISSIAVAPFMNVQIPSILRTTFLIILGFFFGRSISR